MTERKVDCADNTLSTKPGGNSAIVVMASPLTAHHGVEINFRRGGLRRCLVPAQHNEAVFRRAQILMGREGQVAEAGGDLARLRMRQHGHGGLALDLLIVVLGHQIHRAFDRTCRIQVVYDTRQLDTQAP